MPEMRRFEGEYRGSSTEKPRNGPLFTARGATEVFPDRLLDERGEDVTAGLLAAVDRITGWCLERGVRIAFLKENSPSCGTLRIPCRGERVPGPGPLASRLVKAGVRVFTEENFEPGLNALGNHLDRSPDERERALPPEPGKDENSL